MVSPIDKELAEAKQAAAEARRKLRKQQELEENADMPDVFDLGVPEPTGKDDLLLIG